MRERPKILISEGKDYDASALALYKSLGDTIVETTGTRAGLLAALHDYHVLVVRLRYTVDREMLDCAPNLRVIVSPTTGLNHIELEEAKRRGVEVLSLRGESGFLRTIPATAELTWGLVLALHRKIPQAMLAVRSGIWDRDTFRGRDLCGKTLGVVGLGRIGRMVAGFGLAFGMKVLAVDPASPSTEAGVTLCGLSFLLEESDLVSLHVPLMPETLGMIGHGEFARMKRGSYFINTSRGELIDESALVKALESGHLAGAAVDVLQGEHGENKSWMAENPLAVYARQHDNVVVTPHIGGATLESMAMTEVFMAEKFIRWAGASACKEFL